MHVVRGRLPYIHFGKFYVALYNRLAASIVSEGLTLENIPSTLETFFLTCMMYMY